MIRLFLWLALLWIPCSVDANPSSILDSAVLAFKQGNFEDAAFQLERAEQDDPAIGKKTGAIRLHMFLALVHRRLDVFDRLASTITPDPVLAYIIALRRLELRDEESAMKYLRFMVEKQDRNGIKQALKNPARLRSEVPMPFACHAGMEAGFDALTYRPDRLSSLWDAEPGPVEIAAAFFLLESRQNRKLTGILPGEVLPALPESSATFLSLILKPDRKVLLQCATELSQGKASSRRYSYRVLFDLLIHVDDRPVSYSQVAFRYLNEPVADDGSMILALEALHALRAGIDRLPRLETVSSGHMSLEDRRAMEERLLIYRRLQHAYERLNRSSDAHHLAAIALVLEKYLAMPAAFPDKELRDRTGEDLHHREGLMLRYQLSDEQERQRIKEWIRQYDTRNTQEHPVVFRRIYRYN